MKNKIIKDKVCPRCGSQVVEADKKYAHCYGCEEDFYKFELRSK